jgi:hypothetical protein
LEKPSPVSIPPTPDNYSTQAQNPFRDQAVANPYAAPAAGTIAGYRSPEDAKRQVLGPAASMIVASVIGTLLVGLILLAGIMSVAEHGADDDDIVGLVVVSVLLSVELFICFGGVRMLIMRNHTLCLVMAILSVIPCTVGWCFRFPFGIWALIVLFDASVRAAFK